MKIIVHMLAFHDYTPDNEVLREVEIPDDEWDNAGDCNAQLGLVFYYGQNDFQPVPNRCSVSVGDVIELPGSSLFLVCGVGFRHIEWLELARMLRMERVDRHLAAL